MTRGFFYVHEDLTGERVAKFGDGSGVAVEVETAPGMKTVLFLFFFS